jgi:hypothetical protein
LQSIDPVLRAHRSNPLRDGRHDPVAIFDATGVRREHRVIAQRLETKCSSARAPLPIASYRDDEGPVGGVEQLIRN